MDIRTIRSTSVTLPGEEPDDLDPYETVPADRASVVGATITGGTWARAALTGVRLSRSYVINADLASARFDNTTWDRCVITGSTLVGTQIAGGTMKNVIFENCRLDYATLHQIRATGPIALIGCSLIEAVISQCQLPGAVFDGCRFSSTHLDDTDLRGADLRGNNLGGLIGVASTRGITVSMEQLAALTELMVQDLDITVRD
jgi:uncharacterized protein YjbI with pentapeptide repeats